MVVTQSRVELPLFPGQPLDQPLHIPHIQVTRHADEHFRDYQHD